MEISSEKPVARIAAKLPGNPKILQTAPPVRTDLSSRKDGLAGSHRTQFETHLGKGLIKPVAVESSIDGFHFKYDEALRQLVKPETSKPEKIS